MTPRILIVDDDEDARTLYGGYLRSRGWDVVCVDNGEEALNRLDSSFHGAVLDEMMPGMKGMQILQKIRARVNLQHLCVAMMTATTDSKVIIGIFQHKPNVFLDKTTHTKEDLYVALARELSHSMNNPSLRPVRVFLCHSHMDKPKVREIWHKLKTDFVDPWLDKDKLRPGQDWELEINKAVEASDIVVICLSTQVSRP